MPPRFREIGFVVDKSLIHRLSRILTAFAILDKTMDAAGPGGRVFKD